jgi:N6-adenosine-specific RNA methylase IME4
VKYRTIVADPPWPYKNPGEFARGKTPVARGAGSRARYGSMSLDELRQLPVEEFARPDACLYLWTTGAFLEHAPGLVRRWGFRPVHLCTWIKTTQNAACSHGFPKVSPRTGYYWRSCAEFCWFGIRGQPEVDFRRVVPDAWLWPRGKHSAKPEAFFDLVESVSPGPYLELFARRNRLTWDTWGNESFQHVELA